jgi:hypothetical protein
MDLGGSASGADEEKLINEEYKVPREFLPHDPHRP